MDDDAHSGHSHDDHSHDTHSAKCDEEGCVFVAKTHAHDDETAARDLSHKLSAHNRDEHQKQTDPHEIHGEVKEKMESHGH